MRYGIDDDKLHEECGVFGIFSRKFPVALSTYWGLYALQHRGQESAGICVTDGRSMDVQRVKDFTKPSYPDRKEFLRNRNLLGAVLLGTGMVTSACNKTETAHRTPGIVAQPARRLSGVIWESPPPAKEAPPQPGDKPSR